MKTRRRAAAGATPSSSAKKKKKSLTMKASVETKKKEIKKRNGDGGKDAGKKESKFDAPMKSLRKADDGWSVDVSVIFCVVVVKYIAKTKTMVGG